MATLREKIKALDLEKKRDPNQLADTPEQKARMKLGEKANLNFQKRNNLFQFTDPAMISIAQGRKAAREAANQTQEEATASYNEFERLRPKGRLSTIFAGATGLLSTPSVSRRSLMGI